MSKEQQIGLMANLPRVQAQQRILDQRYDPLDYEGVYRLWLDAYGCDELASRARTESMRRLVYERTEAARLER